MPGPKMPLTRNGIRGSALEKLAALSAQTTAEPSGREDMDHLCSLNRGHTAKNTNGLANGLGKTASTSNVPMGIRELEVLVALCRAAPFLQTTQNADELLHQLEPYVAEAHRQTLTHSVLHQDLPPWETLSYDLTSAVLSIGLNHVSLRAPALACIEHTIDELTKGAESLIRSSHEADKSDKKNMAETSLSAIQLIVSLLGFLNATAKYVQIWNVGQRIATILKLRDILSEKFMVSIEGALSAVRNARIHSRSVKVWKRWLRNYASRGVPLGAMLLKQAFMRVVEENVILLLTPNETQPSAQLLDSLMYRKPLVDRACLSYDDDMLEELTDVIVHEINSLEADADYLQVSSAWQQRLALEVKASSLRSYLCCSLINEGIADDELLMSLFDTIASDPVQMADENLAQTVLKSMAVLGRTSSATAASLTHSMPRLLVQGKMTPDTGRVAGECLARVLQELSQDMIISTLYSLGNVLSASAGNDKSAGMGPLFDGNDSLNGASAPYASQQAMGSQISLLFVDEEETTAAYGSIVQAIVAIAYACREEKLTALVVSMLVQKIGRISPAVDARIITQTATLGICGGANQLRPLLRLYARIASESMAKRDHLLTNAVTDARIRLARWISKDSPLYEPYLTHLLDLCVSSGDTAGERSFDVAVATNTIRQLFRPLAVLASNDIEHVPELENREEVLQLSRDAWFNIIVHGFTLNSNASREHAEEIEVLAQYTLPLVDEERVDMPESGVDLNAVLRRGATPERTVELKSTLLDILPHSEADIKSLTYADSVFLNAALLICNARARAGDCTGVLPYFQENKVKTTAMGNVMLSIAINAVDTYLSRALSGQRQDFATPQIALQLVSFFEGACHRIAKVQLAAVSVADRIITQIPSALCQKASLYALLDLLTLMWRSCLDAETDEYEWKAIYTSEKGNVSVQISDDVYYRQTTLTNFHNRCRLWVSKAIDVAPLDVKGLLQAYLEDYKDDGSYGHIVLGRSFAVEMGSMIPNTDQRLTSLDRQRDVGLNTASDFVAQYTTRQQYRQGESQPDPSDEWALVDYNGSSRVAAIDFPISELEEATKLRALAKKLGTHEAVPFSEVRNTLRDAAGALTKGSSDCTPLISDLIGIPFAIFTKQAINLGISLWLGVVKENPSLEPRILVEIASGWESSVRLKKGFFDSSFQHPDPFFVKEEFAPSKWDAITRRQHLTNNLLAPHLRLTHVLASHFSASRLIAPSVEHVYGRLMHITMLSMKRTATQPLAREVHFQIILLALRVLRYSTHMSMATRWRLKDSILSAGLAWFTMPPMWSFGSNKLQVKAEVKVLNDVAARLKELAGIGSNPTTALSSLRPSQELLQLLLAHEIGRLGVWISPTGNDSKNIVPSAAHSGTVRDTEFSPLLTAAWAEDPRIAIQLAERFPQSEKLVSEIRSLIMARPESAIPYSDALYVLLGSSLPQDVKGQLKYLLYWAPINPMAAVTCFLPAYGNNPLVIQYAVRALESHSVDITFFYVPQIVQTLRYDASGYVERYIVETAKFSQLFAHQIIWNMKANAYKDEDSQEPDAVKPVLDRVTGALISSFSRQDQDFYEREFGFFGKVTGISGTLKPFIKSPKPEKKQKIEEELRKIQVEVGVYLPSNPEGVVIGIDRKSGKPLQSHAKAPFMATFRIRKELSQVEPVENSTSANGEYKRRETQELWQSAIFKVGDDCRQDVLVLQMIAAFRGIFNNVGLDVYLFPYRVTATAPGCGVIDVLPNSISRDMLGREAVNGLYEYFISKYGYEDSIRFQEARSNFIKSMAAYSIISFLLQLKDRHNGNIMVDDAGHILHIDFGFCFDIGPGGITFERAPFKLTPEMVAVMGGSTNSQGFRTFEDLCIKAFLTARQHVEQLSHIALTMLDSGLPCFKPQSMKHFRQRFVLEKTEREAADFVRHLVHVSERSYSTGVYDYFQLLTNGIPY